MLDGLEVTIVGAIAPRLTEQGSGIDLDAADIGTAAALYVAGACIGALLFGQLTDRYGRKKLFMLTLALYICATVATAFAFEPWYFLLCRFLTGAGIGGEYAAINSAIDELIPARNRGRVDLAINGSYWVGAAIGALAALLLLDTALFAGRPRLAAGLRRWARSSASGSCSCAATCPRARAGCSSTAARRRPSGSSRQIEEEVREETGQELAAGRGANHGPPARGDPVPRDREPSRSSATRAARCWGWRSSSGRRSSTTPSPSTSGRSSASSSTSRSGDVPYFMVLFALSNFLGPLLLGRFFDTVGRMPMIAGTYLISAAIVAVLGAAAARAARSTRGRSWRSCWRRSSSPRRAPAPRT